MHSRTPFPELRHKMDAYSLIGLSSMDVDELFHRGKAKDPELDA